MAKYERITESVTHMVPVTTKKVVGVTLTLTAEEAYRVNYLCCRDTNGHSYSVMEALNKAGFNHNRSDFGKE